jgi:hypothetical protein
VGHRLHRRLRRRLRVPGAPARARSRGVAARRRHPGRGGGAAAPGTQGRQAGCHDPAARTLPVMLGQRGRSRTAPRPWAWAGTGQRASQTGRGGATIRPSGRLPGLPGARKHHQRPVPGLPGRRADGRAGHGHHPHPARIPEETMLRLAGRGTPSPAAGGEPGDAYVIIRAEAGPRFTRAGADLRHDLHFTVPDAALGATATVPGLTGACGSPFSPALSSVRSCGSPGGAAPLRPARPGRAEHPRPRGHPAAAQPAAAALV